MLALIKLRTTKKCVDYRYEFDIDDTGGFSFPCDEHGKITMDLPKEAMENLHYCLSHLHRFQWHGIRKREFTITEPAEGRCSCGAIVVLENYMGGDTCQCPECGQWYNIWGNALVEPEYWMEH